MYDCVKREIRPTSVQQAYLEKCFGHTRWYWNYMVECGKSKVQAQPHYDLKKQGYEWLGEVPTQALANAKLHYQQAWKNTKNHAKPPVFHSKHGKQSFTVCCQGEKWLDGNKYYVPKLKTAIHLMGKVSVKGTLKSVTVTKESDGKYYAAFMFDVGEIAPLPVVGKNVGLDVGIETFCTTSDGEKIKLPNLSNREQRVVKEQKKLSRKANDSNNRNKQRKKLAKAHKAVSNARKDFHHKLSKRITDENQVIVIEDLATKNMIKNHKLARSISRQGWRQFADMLRYKSERKGRTLIKVDRFYPSSQICSGCGSRGTKKPLNIRKWQCPDCGAIHDRDINAAINILTAGTAGLAC